MHALFIQKWKLENSFIFVSSLTEMMVLWKNVSLTSLHLPIELTSSSYCFSLGKQCCAVDYILHAVDSATALLNSPRRSSSVLHYISLYILFFSGLQISIASHGHFSSLVRCPGCIFAHRLASNLWIISTSWSWTNPLFMPFFCLDSSWIFWSNRRMAIMLEVVKFISGPPPSISAEMNIDDQTRLSQ